ncbi:MAG TPA: APC family permease [Gaiellales bacterium]|nr:APC family permease [Gaiellales bacterium]
MRHGAARVQRGQARDPVSSKGGLIEYLLQGFGNGRLLGVASWLGYAAAFVVVAAMLAVSFGSYAVSLFVADGSWSGWDNVFASLLIVAVTLVNMVGATFVSRVAAVMVVVLLCVFAFFVVVTIPHVDFDLLAFSGYPPFSKIISSIALTFFAFLGFGVMTFTVANLRDPERELPRAVTIALGLTAATYVLISIAVFGALTVNQAIGYGETAIAEAARPTLGDAGFTLMAVAALIATAGATNGTLFGSVGLSGLSLGDRAVSSVSRHPLAARPAWRPARHLSPHPCACQPRRPFCHRLGRECLLARRVPACRARGLPAAVGDGRLGRDRPAGDGRDGDRAWILRGRFAPQRSRHVRSHRRDDAPGGRARRRLEVGE